MTATYDEKTLMDYEFTALELQALNQIVSGMETLSLLMEEGVSKTDLEKQLEDYKVQQRAAGSHLLALRKELFSNDETSS